MSKPTTIEVTFAHSVERNGWHDIPPGVRCYGSYDKEFELRAAVTFYGINDEPEVSWLDKAAVEDLGLTDDEMEGAEEQAIEAAADVLRKRPTLQDEADEAGDRAYDEQRDWQLLAGGE